jgi:hypothetical protein
MNLPGYKLHKLAGKEKGLGQFGLAATRELPFNFVILGLLNAACLFF